ncbi:hypothetical protein Tco_0050112 [Tanacetum coccineum]
MRGIVRLGDARKVFDEMSVKDTCEGSGSKLGAPVGHLSGDCDSDVEIVSCSGNDIAIETNSGSEQEVVFDCCGNQSNKMVDQKEREMVAMEADMAPELNEMSNTVNESEPDVVDVYRTESKNRLSELEEEMTVTNVDVTTKHIPLVVMKVRISVILKN